MTPEELDDIEERALKAESEAWAHNRAHVSDGDVVDLCAALRAAWAERDAAVRVVRDASYRLKTPFMGGEHIRNARDVLEDFTRTLAAGPLPEDFDFRIEQRCVELAAELDEAVARARDAAGCTHKIWEHNTKLMAERDARPSPETVAKVRELLQPIAAADCTDYHATPCVVGMHDKNCRQLGVREALRLLEKP